MAEENNRMVACRGARKRPKESGASKWLKNGMAGDGVGRNEKWAESSGRGRRYRRKSVRHQDRRHQWRAGRHQAISERKSLAMNEKRWRHQAAGVEMAASAGGQIRKKAYLSENNEITGRASARRKS